MQKVFVGRGKIIELKNILHDINAKNVVMFHGKRPLKQNKILIDGLLSGYDTVFYSDFEPNPKYEQIQNAINQLKGHKISAVIAFGGGSVIDFAKAFRFYSGLTAPLIAIPTTSGTGSEATQFAVVYIDGKKTSLDDSVILPEYAIIDSQFSEQVPQYIKACSAIDAYSQAIESYWSVRSTQESQHYAKQSMILCKNNIESYVLSSDSQCCENMALASYLSGKAINISRTTAAHALSYTITTKYGIPHGHCVALSMANLFVANMRVTEDNCNDKRGAYFVRKQLSDILGFLNLKSGAEFAKYWCWLMSKLGLEYNVSKLGIKDKTDIIKNVNAQRLGNNPVKITNLNELFR
jgi:alcohol dehydrogenase class IV